ncbi:MAG: ATP-binding protein [Crinalium sp.]
MINKTFDLIVKNDIESLIINQVPESRTIEYKEKLPGNSDEDKKEFLADISSFANSSGGDIIYGIEELRDGNGKPTGLPNTIKELNGINTDAEIRKLENSIRDGIAPRINGIQTIAVNGFANGSVIIIRIPKSWTSPHIVTFKNSSKFYSRNSAGKYPLDVTEIRAAFALSEALPDRIRRFRDERIAKIIANETPVTLTSGAKIVLHLLPIAFFEAVTQIDIHKIKNSSNLPPINTGSWTSRYNFDGFVRYAILNNPQFSHISNSYVQLFRYGAIEAVYEFPSPDRKLIPSSSYEKYLISAIPKYLEVEQELELLPPIFLMLSLIGVKGYQLSINSPFSNQSHPIDRDVLLLPEAIVEDYKSKASDILRPAFDTVWQSAGWEGSQNYDEKGNWVGNRQGG